jgi:hypothetical protein
LSEYRIAERNQAEKRES